VQEGLTHAAALSRFFWPSKQGGLLAAARGERLREDFNLGKGSPLQQRNLRNTFEHFDEQLDRFFLDWPIGCVFVNDEIIDIGDNYDEYNLTIFRGVDPLRGICVLLGEKFEFQPIRAEAQRILALALEKRKSGWF
jgi:hypothetical protein